MKFKIGDKVLRIKDKHNGMNIGDIGTVTIISTIAIELKEYSGSHNIENFELVEESNTSSREYWRASNTFKYNNRGHGNHSDMTQGKIYTILKGLGDDLEESNYFRDDLQDTRLIRNFEKYIDIIFYQNVKKEMKPLSIYKYNDVNYLVIEGTNDSEKAIVSLKDGKSYKISKDFEYQYIGMLDYEENYIFETIKEEIPREIIITNESSHLLSEYDDYIKEKLKGIK